MSNTFMLTVTDTNESPETTGDDIADITLPNRLGTGAIVASEAKVKAAFKDPDSVTPTGEMLRIFSDRHERQRR